MKRILIIAVLLWVWLLSGCASYDFVPVERPARTIYQPSNQVYWYEWKRGQKPEEIHYDFTPFRLGQRIKKPVEHKTFGSFLKGAALSASGSVWSD